MKGIITSICKSDSFKDRPKSKKTGFINRFFYIYDQNNYLKINKKLFFRKKTKFCVDISQKFGYKKNIK